MLNESAAASGFYFVTGGAVPLDAACYVERPADSSLLDNLRRGEFCYVLVCRQMGKSSLMVRTADRLRDDGIVSVVLDLNAVGSTTSQEQWYYALITTIARKLAIHPQVKTFWEQSAGLSPWQRWIGALEYILSDLFDGRLAIFVDEIDQVLQLKFDTDEFFAGIRSCYSRRSQDAEFNRVSFCLLGVALASDLIENPRITPFNIGNRIGLADFAQKDLRGYAAALQREEILDEVLIERVFYWTNGHPYLTQRLCFEIVNTPEATSPAAVDALCHRLFLSADAQAQDDNIVFVRDRLIRSEEDVTALLNIYKDVLIGRAPRLAKSDRLLSILLLSGIVRVDDGKPRVRNRIYERVFNPDWVRAHLPGAEQRRQDAAYRRGLLRAWLPAIVIISLVSILSVNLYKEKQRADQNASTATLNREKADKSEGEAISAKDAYGHLGSLFYHEHWNPYKSLKVLMDTRPKDSDFGTTKDGRYFMWRWLWHESNQDSELLLDPADQLILAEAISPDGRYLAAGGQEKAGNDSSVWIWDLHSNRPAKPLPFPGEVKYLAFALKGNLLVAAGGRTGLYSEPGVIRRWSVPDFVQHGRDLQRNSGEVLGGAIDQDGNTLATISGGSAEGWNIGASSPVQKFIQGGGFGGLSSVAISRDLTAAAHGDRIRLTDNKAPQRKVRDLTWPYSTRDSEDPAALAFSPDGKSLVSGHLNGSIRVWDLSTYKFKPITKHPAKIASVAFSPSGDMIATACWDNHVRLLDSKSGILLQDYVGHVGLVNSVAFVRLPEGMELALRGSALEGSRPARGGLYIVSGSNDGSIRFWSAERALIAPTQLTLNEPVKALVTSPDKESLAITSLNNKTHLRVCSSGVDLSPRIRGAAQIAAAAYAPTSVGPIMALLDNNGVVHIVDYHTNSRAKPFQAFTTQQPWSSTYYSITYSPDGRYLAVKGRSVTIWDSRTYQKMAAIPPQHLQDSGIMTISPNGNTIVLGGQDTDPRIGGDGSIEIWDMHNPAKPVETGCIHEANGGNYINAMAISPDNMKLASAGWNQTVRLWDLSDCKGEHHGETERRDNILQVRAGPVNCIAFSPDGKELYVGNNDSTISVWDVKTKFERGVIGGHTGPVTDIHFVDKDTLISASEAGTVRYWYATPTGELAGQLDDPVRVEWLKKKLN